jgi:hypothetical protein
MKYKLKKNSGTYMYKKNNNFEGNRYFISSTHKTPKIHILQYQTLRCTCTVD